MVPRVLGMTPERILLEISKHCSDDRLPVPMVAGMVPVSPVPANCKMTRDVKLPRKVGNVPAASRLYDSDNADSAVKLLIVVGMLPVNELESSHSDARFWMPPRALGMVPLN